MRSRLPFLAISREVEAALAANRPVVALESTLLAHGLPWPQNLAVGLQAEQEVRNAGAVPATIAVFSGRIHVGLDADTLETVARSPHVFKASAADLGPILASRKDAATTVSATVVAAARAGISVMATGGIGGVHRGDTHDVSCDLTTLAQEPVAVVSAGAKVILDLPATLEVLETLGVPVVGIATSDFPAFYAPKSGLPVLHRVENPEDTASLLRSHFALFPGRGALLCNPIPEADALPEALVSQALATALQAAEQAQVKGKALTPFLLSKIAEATGSQSTKANLALVLHNARVAGQIAVALCKEPPVE
jgi:pseudouridine-5'-phosphate glycosidase